jgi:hypothetical protein
VIEHIKNFFGWAKHFVILIGWILLYILGYIMVPIGILLSNDGKDFMPKLFYLWDNITDTRFGNAEWQYVWGDKITNFWTQFLWLQVRNPLHNYCYLNGVKELPKTPRYKLFGFGNIYIGYRLRQYDGSDVYGWRGMFIQN